MKKQKYPRGFSQETVNALLRGLVRPFPGKEDELDWFFADETEEQEMAEKLRQILNVEGKTFAELKQLYQEQEWQDDTF
ncbi:hypothetical protein WDW89_04520 [Deltaproteobacteria bacterium TL4]